MNKTTPIIGLEVHLELKTNSKMFCSCPANHFHISPNTHTCPVCLGLPGALPVPNQKALNYCAKLGLALNCSINPDSFFERKNYFYPDLPKGFQISQYQQPLTIKGHLVIPGQIDGSKPQTIRINRVHMEEDTAKSIHLDDSTLIDFNRSGVPLVEIVTEPDLTSSTQAKEYLVQIQRLVRYLGISTADIEEGSMRCEPTVNLKIQKNGQTFYTPIVEIKNVASLTGVQKAIDYEINRQSKLFSKTNQTKNKTNKTTRGWDADKKVTFLQRQKEGSSDYRYFPEPDIPPIKYNQARIDKIKSTIPELPMQKSIRFQEKFGLSAYNANLIVENKKLALDSETILQALMEKTKDKESGSFFANLFNGPIRQHLNKTKKDFDISKMPGEYFIDLFNAVKESKISMSVAKQLIVNSYQTQTPPLQIAQQKGLMQISDEKKLEKIIKKVITDNQKAVEDYQKNPNTIGFLIGQVMQTTSGSANPQIVAQILKKLLS